MSGLNQVKGQGPIYAQYDRPVAEAKKAENPSLLDKAINFLSETIDKIKGLFGSPVEASKDLKNQVIELTEITSNKDEFYFKKNVYKNMVIKDKNVQILIDPKAKSVQKNNKTSFEFSQSKFDDTSTAKKGILLAIAEIPEEDKSAYATFLLVIMEKSGKVNNNITDMTSTATGLLRLIKSDPDLEEAVITSSRPLSDEQLAGINKRLDNTIHSTTNSYIDGTMDIHRTTYDKLQSKGFIKGIFGKETEQRTRSNQLLKSVQQTAPNISDEEANNSVEIINSVVSSLYYKTELSTNPQEQGNIDSSQPLTKQNLAKITDDSDNKDKVSFEIKQDNKNFYVTMQKDISTNLEKLHDIKLGDGLELSNRKFEVTVTIPKMVEHHENGETKLVSNLTKPAYGDFRPEFSTTVKVLV